MTRVAGILVVVALGLAGCKRPKPSPAYAEASSAHSSLVAEQGDDAYADPEMDRIVGLLDTVPADSTDAANAAELKRLIAAERKRVADEAAAAKRRLDSLNGAPPSFDSPSAPEPTPEAAGGGGGGEWSLTPGMTPEEVSKASGDCFASAGPIKLKRPDKTEAAGEMYAPKDTPQCRERVQQYQGRVLIFRDGKLAGNFERGAISQEPAPLPTNPPLTGQPPVGPGAAPPAPPPGSPPAPAPTPGAPFYPGAPAPGAEPVSPGENTGPAPTQ